MDQENENRDLELQASGSSERVEELDAAGKSLSDALRLSFFILKIVMAILIVAFLASGFKTIGSDEVGLLLRFGQFVPVGEERVIGPGAKWVFPYPIDEVIKIPVKRKVNVPINSFWYYQTQAELLNEEQDRRRIPAKLDPMKDGYLLTHGGGVDAQSRAEDGTDYNIVHTRWQLTYQIDDAERFFRNVYVDAAKPGDVYFDLITESVEPLLTSVFEDAVVTAMVDYTIDGVLFERVAAVTDHVRTLVDEKLDAINSGIRVVSVQLVDKTWPRQVDQAFQESITVSQQGDQMIREARTRAENVLNEAAGPVAAQLYQAIRDPNAPEDELETFWSRLSGQAQNLIYDAQEYRSSVAKKARASADYLQSLLPEYRKRPELVLQRLYLDAIENVFANADEKIILEPSGEPDREELRILLNRDRSLKPKKGGQATTGGQAGQ